MKLLKPVLPLFVIFALVPVTTPSAAGKEPPGPDAPAAAELQTIARKLGKPAFTAAVANSKQTIADWSARSAKSKSPQPLVLQIGPSAELRNIKKGTVQTALGTPSRKTTDTMPALVDRSGAAKAIPACWYGNVGLGFATGEGFDLGLCMIKLTYTR